MTRLISLFILLIFTWTTVVQAIPHKDFDSSIRINPSLQTWKDMALGSKVAFEALDAGGAAVAKTASFARQGLRAVGVSSDTAQVTVYVIDKLIEAWTFGKGGVSLASNVSTKISKTSRASIGVSQTTNSIASNVTKTSFGKTHTTHINAFDDITLGRASNSNFTQVNHFERITKVGQRTPANQTPLTKNQARATGTQGGTPIPAHIPEATGQTYLGNQSRNVRFTETMSSGGNTRKPGMTPINLGSTSNPHTTPITASAPKATTTPVPPKNTSKIPEYDSILFYGKTPGANGELIDVAVGIKDKKTHVLELTPKTTGLVEGAEEASAAAKKYWARVEQAKLPPELRPYIREVEAKSGLTVHPKQRELLAEDLRQNAYTKLDKDAYTAHQKPFQNKSFKNKLISEWEQNTGRKWSTYMKADPKTGIVKPYNYQAHHINPQQLGGKHEWWNMHPVHPNSHQGGVHGTGSQLNKIVKELNENG